MLGIDVGYGNCKIFDGENEYGFQSVYVPTDEEYDEDENAEVIHVKIDGQMLYVGKKAIVNGGNAQFDALDLSRHKLFVLTSIAVATDGQDFEDAVGLGLPKADMKAMKDKLKSLKGEYDIEFKGKKMHINITDVTVSVQGQCVIREIQQYEDISGLTVGVIDVGQKTTDFSLYDDGIRVDKASSSMDTGVIQALSAISEEYRNISAMEVEAYAVPAKLKRGVIAAELADKHFSQLAEKVITNLSGLGWLRTPISKIYLIGGGCVYLEEELKKSFPMAELHPAYIYANARAYQLTKPAATHKKKGGKK